MGFLGLGGKKKAGASEEPAPAAKTAEAPATRKSVRRVVGGKPATGPVKPTERQAQVTAKTGTRPPAAKPAAPAPEQIEEPIELGAPIVAAGDGDIDLGAPLDLGAAPAPATPGAGKQPITSSKPPEFGGSLTTAVPAGPSRGGDAALIEFLTGKAALINADQAAQMQAKAAADGVALDLAGTRMGLFTEDQLVTALTQECWVPHLKVDKYEIRKKALDTVVKDDAVALSVFPVDKLGSLLTLAMVNPLDQAAIAAIESKTGLDVKKVVATRGEIERAIEKYYSGLAVATDVSRSFTNDAVEPKSATQMMLNVGSKPAAPAPAPAATAAPADVSAEIMDIDDLLSSEEVVAPTIIEPIAIKPIAADAIDLVDTAAIAPSIQPALDLVDAPRSGTGALTKAPPKPAAPAVQFELEDSSAPAAAAPAITPAAPMPQAPAMPAAPAPRPQSETRSPVTGRITSSHDRRPATARFTQTTGAVNLLPVTEEEFRHAVSHGKSQAFDKWCALQSRNRIINAVPVEPDIAKLLAPLFASPRG